MDPSTKREGMQDESDILVALGLIGRPPSCIDGKAIAILVLYVCREAHLPDRVGKLVP